MAMIKVNFGAAITGWNATTSPSVGTKFADLLDDGGSATGIAFRNEGSYNFSGADRASGDFHGLPEAYWDGLFFQSGAMQFTLSGLTAYNGQSYTLTTAHFSNSARDNDVTVGGTTQQYNSIAGNPPAPLVFTGTVSGDTLVIDIALVSGTVTTYFQGFTLELVSSGLSLDSTPTEVNNQTQKSSVVSTPATAPTTLNSAVRLVNASGPLADWNSITGSDPYTFNYTFNRLTAKLFSATGYPLYHEVDAENVTSGNVPYLPIATQTFIDLVTPVDTVGTLGETYAGGASATGDQWVYDTNLTGDATVTLTVDAQGYWEISGTPSVTSTADFYRIDSLETVDVEDTITFEVGGAPSTGDAKLVKPLVTSIINSLVKNTVG